MHENPEYDIPVDPPFKGEAWVEELEKVFDRLQNEWEAGQMNSETAQSDGPYHPRSGSMLLAFLDVCFFIVCCNGNCELALISSIAAMRRGANMLRSFL
jgi:hypothetical protein